MFNKDFYPTPDDVIYKMVDCEPIQGKVILEPSAGKGNIVDFLIQHGAAQVIACEKNADLKAILANKCEILTDDFLTVTSEQVSHVDYIVMNPPFSADEKHIIHAYEIAPAGCRIIALCNSETVENTYYEGRRKLKHFINESGSFEDLGNCFSDAERKTEVRVSLIRMTKPGESTKNEFDGFFLEDETEAQENGILSYNVIRDLVNRYVGAIKIYDDQLEAAVKMNSLTNGFFDGELSMSITADQKPLKRAEYKKQLQKAGWRWIFSKLNMEKYSTKGLREDLNKFVETQTHIPFTMRNIYKMLEIVVGTQGQRMDKAILEVFDQLTKHYDENRWNVEGWKTNSHYLINEKFIMPYMVESNWSGKLRANWGVRVDLIEDMVKAICFITGMDYGQTTTFRDFLNNNECDWGKWYSWGFFEIRSYKKGTTHFKFNSKDLWAKFNQKVAELKGYPLPEAIRTKETKRRDEETAKRYKPEPEPTKPKATAPAQVPNIVIENGQVVLFEFQKAS